VFICSIILCVDRDTVDLGISTQLKYGFCSRYVFHFSIKSDVDEAVYSSHPSSLARPCLIYLSMLTPLADLHRVQHDSRVPHRVAVRRLSFFQSNICILTTMRAETACSRP
jgi:hypothetical protein